ncbi:MAG: SCO family protein [Phycisphaerales bacterium]|nr:SCO family protein [Phycisphaerales bacterium]
MIRSAGSIMLLTGAIAGALATSASAQLAMPSDQTPVELESVGIEQHLDAQLPGDLVFQDQAGGDVRLGDLVASGERPIILTLNYYRCPQLCKLTLNGLVDSLSDVDLEMGSDFDVVTVSIDPEEGPELAAQNRKGYLAAAAQQGVNAAEGAWPFLVGDEASIKELADVSGFGYRYDEKSGEYAHSSSIMFITPDGRISKYMNDVRFNPRDVHLSLVEASQGKIGSLVDGFLLLNCFQWDPNTNSYVANAWKLMRLGGVFIVLLILIGWFVLWRMGRADQDGGGPMMGKEVLS